MSRHPQKPRLAWALTGSGHFFTECMDLMHEIGELDVFVSKAGAEVVRMYKHDLAMLPEPARVFRDTTASHGVDFVHRSSRWLGEFRHRQLKTPPTFSGGGVAAEDVDGDGDCDLLFVGGARSMPSSSPPTMNMPRRHLSKGR